MKISTMSAIYLQKFLEHFAFTFLILIFSILATSSVFFFFDINISAANFIVPFIFTFVISAYISKKPYLTLANLIICFLFILAAYCFESRIFDPSYDGGTYHRPAIKMLASGWNPFNLKEAYPSAQKWIIYFPKATWIIQAVFVNAFSKLSAYGAKAYNFILSIIAMFYGYISLYKLNISKNKVLIIFLSALAVFNTVNLTQLHTFMTDGALSSAIIIYICAIALYIKERSKVNIFVIFMSLCILINTKLSAPAYAVVISLGAIFLFSGKREKIKFSLIIFCSVLIAMFLIGFNPYFTNLYKFKNPFFPIGEKNTVTIMFDEVPKKLKNKNRIEKFYLSTYSKSDIKGSINLKSPLNISKKELSQINFDTRICGWGVLWGLIFSLSIISLFFLHKTQDFKTLLICIGTILVSVLINPECWWARFVPQAALIPVFIAAYSLKYYQYLIAGTIIFLLVLNIIL